MVYAPVDVIVQEEPLRTRQPDLLFISNENPIERDPVVRGAPDLVVQVLSPSNFRSDVASKLEDYATLGVSECWIVSPEAGTVEVLGRADQGWTRIALRSLGDSLESAVLSGLNLAVAEIFDEP